MPTIVQKDKHSKRDCLFLVFILLSMRKLLEVPLNSPVI